MIQQSLGQWLSSLKVGQKIGLGYTIALGIALSGTIAGFTVGYNYRQRAEQQEVHSRNEVELLHRLQSQVLQARTHQQQLIPLVQYPERFQNEYAHLLTHETELKEIWVELKEFTVESSPLTDQMHQEMISAFLQTYEGIPQRYTKELAQRVEQIRNLNLASPNDVQQAQLLLLNFTNSDLALKFDGISDALVSSIDQSYQNLEAAERSHIRASEVAETIVVASIGLSVAIAILLALLTSRAIAQPIQALTSIAQRATKESNFELQAAITRNDEIGTLALTFNQLIHSVQYLLQQQKAANAQLETYSQTLESRVEQRTQELNDKNIQLQQLLEELQRTQVQIVQSEKMSALGQMVAGVAHEINNPVSFIHGNLSHVREHVQRLLGFVQLHQQHYPNPVPEIEAEAKDLDIEFIQADLPKTLDSMKLGTDRISQIVLSLRNFSRLDESDLKAADIHEGIESTLLILQHRLNDRPGYPAIQVIRDYGSLPQVECYPGQMNQVFLNILINAIDALEAEQADRASEHQTDDPQTDDLHRQITIWTSMVDSNWVKIAISDNGVGMSESVQKRIFDPFFTTKSFGKGTGMGLSISYQIVTEKHGGKLECFSVPAQGTEFIIQIPVQHSPSYVSDRRIN